jgi:hypothetical protein
MFQTIEENCGLFITESAGNPLVKSLPRSLHDFNRIKVRKKKGKSDFDEVFNDSFLNEYSDIRHRAVFASGTQVEDDLHEHFYIFPIDSYDFMFSPMVSNSTVEYRDTFDTLIEAAGKDNGVEIFKDMLKMSYQYNDLPKALKSGCEIILYGISHYYAVRKSSVVNYNSLIYNMN